MRLIDRVLARQGYNEAMYSGAYYVSTSDPSGRSREGAAEGIIRQARDAYAANGIVFACIVARMALLSQARFLFQSTADKHVFTDQRLSILEYPWPGATTAELFARMEHDVCTAGNSFIRKVNPADGSDPLLLQMRPDCVTIVSEEKRDDMGRIYKQPIGYSEDLVPLGITDREPQFYSTAEVAHFSPVPLGAGHFRGETWLTSVLREVGADIALTQYKTTHVARGAMPGLVLKYSQKLSQPSVDRLKARFAAMYSGPENAGRTLILDEGADVTVAGSTLEQLQYTAVQAAGETRIIAAAQVPAEIIGIEGARAASGNYELAIRRFADLWARWEWQGACASLQHLLPGVQAPARLWYDVSEIAALREGELARGQTTLVKAQAVSAFVAAGYTRESAITAADSGDLSQLQADPAAAAGQVNTRRPQAGVPQDLPGVVAPNKPNALPMGPQVMPGMPNGARG